MTPQKFIEMVAGAEDAEDEKGLKKLGLVASSLAHRLSGAEGPSPLVAKRMERAEEHELSIVSALVTLREASPEDRDLVREAYQEMVKAGEAEPYVMMGVLLEMVSAETDLAVSEAMLEKAGKRREQAYKAVLDQEVELSSRTRVEQLADQAYEASLEVLEESQEILGGLASRMTRAVNPNRVEQVGAWLSELRERKEPYDERSYFQQKVIEQIRDEPELFEKIVVVGTPERLAELRGRQTKWERWVQIARAQGREEKAVQFEASARALQTNIHLLETLEQQLAGAGGNYESLLLTEEQRKLIWEAVPKTAFAMMRVSGEFDAELEWTIAELTYGKPRKEFATKEHPEGVTFVEKQREYGERNAQWMILVGRIGETGLSTEGHTELVGQARRESEAVCEELERVQNNLAEKYQFLTESVTQITDGELAWGDLTLTDLSAITAGSREEFGNGEWGTIDPAGMIPADRRAQLQALSGDKKVWGALARVSRVDGVRDLKDVEQKIDVLNDVRERLNIEDERTRPTELHNTTQQALMEAVAQIDSTDGYLPVKVREFLAIHTKMAEVNTDTINELQNIRSELFTKSVRAVVALQLGGDAGKVAKGALMEEYQGLAERLGGGLEEQAVQAREAFVDGQEAREELAGRRMVLRAADRLTEREQTKAENARALVKAGQSQVGRLAAEAGVDADAIFRVAREFGVLDELAADISTEERVRDELLYGRRMSSDARSDVEARLNRAESLGVEIARKREQGQPITVDLRDMTDEILDMMIGTGSAIRQADKQELVRLISREVRRESTYWQIVLMVMTQLQRFEKGKSQRKPRTS